MQTQIILNDWEPFRIFYNTLPFVEILFCDIAPGSHATVKLNIAQLEELKKEIEVTLKNIREERALDTL